MQVEINFQNIHFKRFTTLRLEPHSNTEYISQNTLLITSFALLNLANSMMLRNSENGTGNYPTINL